MPGPNVLVAGVTGLPLSGTNYNNNLGLIETSFLDVGRYVISGLVPTAGTGLSVNVTLGEALIGADITFPAFVIGSLVNGTTNHLYVLRNGTGTSNTTGTAPANSAKIGTCITAGGVVTSVQTGRTSGRQQRQQTQNLVPGGPASGITSAGHPDGLNLASWGATDAEGQAFYGVLPSGAVPADTDSLAALTDVSLSGTAQGDLLYRGASAWNNLAHGTSGQVLITGGAAANPSWSSTLNLGACTFSGIANSGTYGGSGTAWTAKRHIRTFTSDADYTLGAGEMDCLLIDIQTDAVLTTTRNIIVPGSAGGVYDVINRNAQAIGLKTAGGTSIVVASHRAARIYFPGGTNAFRVSPDVDYTV